MVDISKKEALSLSGKEASLLFLGTGGSMGVPVITCRCPVCSSSSPFNRRRRPSALISYRDTHLIIDVGPDFRQQILDHRIFHLDGALVTHAHYDHIGGFDDLRILSLKKGDSFPVLSSKETAQELQTRFSYLFKPKGTIASHIKLSLLPKEEGEMIFCGLRFTYFSYIQQGMKVSGFRLGSLAYVSDILEYHPSLVEHVRGVDTLIVSALRYEASPAHFTIEQAIEFSRLVQAKHTFLTHIAHDLDHNELKKSLPAGITPAYDGLKVFFTTY